MRRIIPLYIIREFLPPFFANLLVFTFILLMGRILQITDLIVVRGIRAGTVINLILFNIPFFLSMTIPMATLMAVLTTFLRLSSDNEITVLKSAGVGLYQLLPPVILFCLWTYLLTSYLTLQLVPAANHAFRNQLLLVAKQRADISINEQVFNTGFKNMVVFVNHISLETDMMQDIFIRDDRNPNVASVIVASTGRLATDEQRGAVILQLFDGIIDQVYPDKTSSETIGFNRYELRLDMEGGLSDPELMKPDQKEMSTTELWEAAEALKDKNPNLYSTYVMDAHKRFAMPVACLVLGLVGVPLGVQFRGRGRGWNVSLGLSLFLIYYILQSAAWSFGKSNQFPLGLGIWMPNIIIGTTAVFMIYKANHEKTIGLIRAINRLYDRLKTTQGEKA